ncbi:hypothetical protein V500_00357 [Pseudogymnoascus sp. VKM F-4518 (FW-2643)]|nr:hypothetical protein V500_00357 [Pseudogymnoascus sp. VKM F-4518 (FW-2643)]
MEIPIAHTGGSVKSVLENGRKNPRSAKLSTKMTSMSRIEQWRESIEGGVQEEGEDLGDDGFQPFCATCEKQIATSNASHLFCSETCRLCDSKLGANGTTNVRLDWKHCLGEVAALDNKN